MTTPFFDITRQNASLAKKIDQSIKQVINSGHFILGENVATLEKEVAALCGVKFAVGVASGTDALHLALKAAGIKPGDEVITSPFTFVATVEAISYCGATPVFADIEPKTFNLDPSKVTAAVTRKTRAILPVHLFGNPCEMDRLQKIAAKHDLAVIEDCAQSIGAKFEGRPAGGFGLAGCFSFFPTKNMGCFGDGGMITTNDADLAQEIKALRGHGSHKTYFYDLVGYNSRLDEIQAAILRVKLPHLAKWTERRRNNAALYRRYLRNLPGIKLPAENPKSFHVYNQFTLRLKERDQLLGYLKSKGIGAMVYYPLSLHLQPAFRDLGYKQGDFPQSEAAQQAVLSLPIYPEMPETDIKRVCQTVRSFFAR